MKVLKLLITNNEKIISENELLLALKNELNRLLKTENKETVLNEGSLFIKDIFKLCEADDFLNQDIEKETLITKENIFKVLVLENEGLSEEEKLFFHLNIGEN